MCVPEAATSLGHSSPAFEKKKKKKTEGTDDSGEQGNLSLIFVVSEKMLHVFLPV